MKVLDFGLAKTAPAVMIPAGTDPGAIDRATVTLPATTQADVILGTADYMAPEQAKGQAVDRRADIWAFGCVVFELLTGRPCFAGESVTEVLAAVLTREPDWAALPKTTPDSMRRLLRRCLEKDPKRRLRDIGDARLELRRAPSLLNHPCRRPRAGPVLPDGRSAWASFWRSSCSRHSGTPS